MQLETDAYGDLTSNNHLGGMSATQNPNRRHRRHARIDEGEETPGFEEQPGTIARSIQGDRKVPVTAPQPRVRLHDLPAETVVHILRFLPARNIALSRTVCRSFRDLVNASVVLLYQIECYVAGVVEGSLAAADSLKDCLPAVRAGASRGACRAGRRRIASADFGRPRSGSRGGLCSLLAKSL